MAYDFYLKKCLLPIPPQKLQIKINNANKTLSLINEGEINILKKAELSDIEFECELPQVKYPFAVYKSSFKNAEYFLNYFENLKTGLKPFQFIVSRTLPNGKVLFSTNFKVTMESYTIDESAANGFDVTVKIKLKQWRDYGTKTVSIKTTSSSTTAAVEKKRSAESSPAPAETQSYTVVAGDCLWNIAKKYYGDGSLYTKLVEANQNVLASRSPNLIFAGDVLTIPAI